MGYALRTAWFFTYLLSSFPPEKYFVTRNSFPFMPQIIRCYHVISRITYYLGPLEGF